MEEHAPEKVPESRLRRRLKAVVLPTLGEFVPTNNGCITGFMCHFLNMDQVSHLNLGCLCLMEFTDCLMESCRHRRLDRFACNPET